MCARYDLTIPREAYAHVFDADIATDSNFPPRFNVAPTDQVPIVRRNREGNREVVIARWGFVPHWSTQMPKVPHINARAETVHSNGMFRDAFARSRCLIPATGYFEWQTLPDGKQPWRFTIKGGSPMAFAGLTTKAQIGDRTIRSMTMIVGEGNPLTSAVHDRMPIILRPVDYERWLSPSASIEELRGLLVPFDHEAMECYPVSRVVNSVRNDVEECVRPLST